MAAEYFPDTISRDRALKMLKRAIELIEKPPTPRKQCKRDADIDIDAKNTLRFLTGDPNIGSTTDDSSQGGSERQQDDEYCPDLFVVDNQPRVSDSTIRRILELHARGISEKAIQSQYRWYRRQYISRMQSYMEAGGSRLNVRDSINDYVLQKMNNSIARQLPIHDYHLQQWVQQVTDLSSCADRVNKASIQDSMIAFAENYRQVAQLYPHHRILNVDQSGHKYEISNLRSLARRGTRDHVLAIDSVNKNTHSYNIQLILTRSGTLIGKLLICFREQSDKFGVEVRRRVRRLEEELGNVVALARGSGKMSRRLTIKWVDEVLAPEMVRLDEADGESISSQDSQSTELAGPSWASNPPETWTPEQNRIMQLRNASSSTRRPGVMLLFDSWGGHASDSLAEEFEERNIFVLRIPPRTTGELQPLDVQVFRQYKIFVKRVTEAASYEGILQNLTDRYGIMRMHFVIWNQFQSQAYRDMLLWAWRHTDPFFTSDELTDSPPPDMVGVLGYCHTLRIE